MRSRLNLAKVIAGAFAVPWRNRSRFARGLAVPLLTLVALLLVWRSTFSNLPAIGNLLFYLAQIAVFVVLAVNCHRLVLLDPTLATPTLFPGWSRRETRFFLLLVAVLAISFAVVVALTVLATSIWKLFGGFEPAWFDRIQDVARIPALYVVGRFSLVFPGTAVDRKATLKWSWDVTRHNGWRLFVVVGLLPWVLFWLAGYLYWGEPAPITTAVVTLAAYATTVFPVSALSLSYRELAPDDTVVA